MVSGMRGCAAVVVALGTMLASGMAMAASGAAALNSAPAASGVRAAAATTVCAGCFAVVDAGGGFVRGKGVVSVSKLGVGIYDVRFNKRIGKCAWTATIGQGFFGGGGSNGEISVTGRSGTNNGIFLTTFDSTGAFADRDFHLLISC